MFRIKCIVTRCDYVMVFLKLASISVLFALTLQVYGYSSVLSARTTSNSTELLKVRRPNLPEKVSETADRRQITRHFFRLPEYVNEIQ